MTRIFALLLAILPEPVFSDWNLRLLRGLFHILPHTAFRDVVAQFVVDNALASTFVFAVVFYGYWRIRDDRSGWRRSRLLALALVLSALALVTLALRPWIGWPAPVLAIRFRTLYPENLWSEGNSNCFPSHSTFIYLCIALGVWPLNRKFSAILAVWALVLISLPRVYVGGHYPVDIIAGALLAVFALWVVGVTCGYDPVRSGLERISSAGLWVELLVFLWLFELAEGFRSTFSILTIAAHTVERLW